MERLKAAELFLRGIVAKAAGNVKIAREALMAYRSLEPEDPSVYLSLAELSLANDEVEESVYFLSQCLEVNESYAIARKKLEDICRRYGWNMPS